MRRSVHVSVRSAVGAAPLLMIAPAMALADIGNDDHGPSMMWGGSWSGWLMGPVTMLLFLGAIIALIVILVRWLGGQGIGGGARSPHPEKDALDILRERFARGEIDRSEFEERKQLLES